jgi:outer membrane protein OmpA-like peptidoglycan-associated protein
MNNKTILLSAHLLIGVLPFGVLSFRGYAQETKRDSLAVKRDNLAVKRDTLIVHFPFNRYDETVGDERKINAYLAGAELKKISFDSITVTGHTDQTGSAGYNQELSRKRADFVSRYLNSLASPVSRIDARGKTEPVSDIDSLNRRVVVVFSYRVADMAVVKASADTGKATNDMPDARSIVNIKPVLDTIVTLANIFFVGNSPELTPSSRMALPSTISSLRTYIHRTIRILGNCNSPGPILKKDHPLYVLSVKRAKVIYEYLIKEGFDPQKLSFVGLGNTAMKNPHPTTRAQMEENMRVDVEVYKQ